MKILIVFALFIIALVTLYKFKFFKICVFLIIAAILLTSGWVGAHAAGASSDFLLPYIIYGADRVKSENINVIDYRDHKFFLSNGDVIPFDKTRSLSLIMRVIFALAGGTVMLLEYKAVLSLSGKFLPNLYQGLAYFSRSRFK
ncbi:MAG: hypothetical protein ABSG97_04380 [Sedimentisphaerales bacterium]|jgi:hypothetical protein